MYFKSKASTLKKINIKKGIIPKLFSFKVKEFKKKELYFLKKIQKIFSSKIAIRSSASGEDNLLSSKAGKYKSFLNVDPKNTHFVQKRIKEVISSYSRVNNKDEVLIQKMVENVTSSGVATSCDKDTFAPYVIINFSNNKKTDHVTSGKKDTKNFIFYKYSKKLPKNRNIKKVINLIKFLEKQINYDHFEIEFIIDKNGKLYLVQLRPIVNKNKIKTENYDKLLFKLSKKIKKLQSPHHDLDGNTTAFGVMPDWNPAEMIGIKPKPLALSLYKKLITDQVWSQQRGDYGYKHVNSNYLMASFFGTPYIDVRVDFNSWIPKNLDEKISKKLTNFYINKFIKNKNLHDKIEFEIIFSCFTASTENKLKELLKHSFSHKEIKKILKALREINLLTFQKFSNNLKLIEKLKEKQEKISKSKLYHIDKIYWLIEDCKRYGTLPFAGIARSAFIAKDILLSFVDQKIITKNDYDNFLKSINTVTSDITKNLQLLGKKEFLKKYGHLRPNTYDINSKNYKKGFHKYFKLKANNKNFENKIFNFSNNQKKLINSFLKKNKLKLNFNEFINFLKNSIKEREYSKFVFTKSIDMIFDYLKIFGRRVGLNENDLAFVDIHNVVDLYYNLSKHDLRKKFSLEVNTNRIDYQTNLKLKLPETITSDNDVYYYFESENKINFAGNRKVSGEVIAINKKLNGNFSNKIIVIESADPGYDFLFSRNIKGLITKYGGVNSHMSIRCSELNVPAAIGVGEKKYNELIKSKIVNLDCITQKLDILK